MLPKGMRPRTRRTCSERTGRRPDWPTRQGKTGRRLGQQGPKTGKGADRRLLMEEDSRRDKAGKDGSIGLGQERVGRVHVHEERGDESRKIRWNQQDKDTRDLDEDAREDSQLRETQALGDKPGPLDVLNFNRGVLDGRYSEPNRLFRDDWVPGHGPSHLANADA